MAKLAFRNETVTDPSRIAALLGACGVTYERWGVRDAETAPDEQVLAIYRPEIDRLMTERGYVSADLVALRPSTPNLEVLLAKFDKEHHHSDDEVRFTVAGEGVFEIETADDSGEFAVFTAEPGDLIVVPARRRHLFYLTAKQQIRTIRLFRTTAGWEAIYAKPSRA